MVKAPTILVFPQLQARVTVEIIGQAVFQTSTSVSTQGAGSERGADEERREAGDCKRLRAHGLSLGGDFASSQQPVVLLR